MDAVSPVMIPDVTPTFVNLIPMGTVTARTAGNSWVIIDAVTPIIRTTRPQSLAAAMSGYQVDRVDFLTLLDSQVKLFGFEIAYNHHTSEREKALAGLEAVVGKRLF